MTGAFDAPRFHEAVLLLDRPVAPVLAALAQRGIFGGLDLAPSYPELGARAAGVRDRNQVERRHRGVWRALRDVLACRAMCAAPHERDPPWRTQATRAVDIRTEQAGPARLDPVPAAARCRPRGASADVPPHLRRGCARRALPEVSELQAVRHFTRLSQMNFSIDTHFYPLGSCTMKYNPKACNSFAMLPEFLARHPLGPEPQGFLACMYELQEMLQGDHRHAGRESHAHGRRAGRIRRASP